MKIDKAYSSGDNGGMQELLGYIKNYILTKLATKQNTLTFDDNPTQNSANPVKSGGVWSGLQSKANDSAVVHKTTDESINGTKTFNSGIVAKANGVCTNTIATDPDSSDTSIDVDASLNVSGNVKDGGNNVLSNKSDKPEDPTANNLASLDSNGNLKDSGYSKDILSTDTTTTAAGNPVTFATKSAQLATEVEVTAKPIQDLHGYDHPWAGGAGKNKLDTSNWMITPDGSTQTDVYLNLTANTTYTVSANVPDSSVAGGGLIYAMDSSGSPSYGSNAVYNGRPVTVTTGADGVLRISYYNRGYITDWTDWHIQAEEGSTPTTFAPYSNICSISGIDEVEIGVSGKNLFDANSVQYGYFNSEGTISEAAVNAAWRCIYLHIIGGSTITVSGCNENNYTYVCWFDADKNLISSEQGHKNKTYTAPATAVYMGVNAIQMDNASHDVDTMMVEYGSSASSYEPYNPNSHTTTIPLPSTLYGGTVDVTEGEATEEIKIITLDGSDDENWTELSNYYRITYLLSDYDNDYTKCKCNLFAIGSTFDVNMGYVTELGTLYTSEAIHDLFPTISAWKTYLASNPLVLAYSTTTPTTLSLTPTDVELLEGTNVLTTNGEKVAVTYRDGAFATLGDLANEVANIGGILTPLNVTIGEHYVIDNPDEIEAIIISCVYDNNGSKFIMPAAYLNMDKISLGDTYFFEYTIDNTSIEVSIGCSFYMTNSGKLQIYINDLSGFITASVGCFSKNNTYTALVADEIDNILDTNY